MNSVGTVNLSSVDNYNCFHGKFNHYIHGICGFKKFKNSCGQYATVFQIKSYMLKNANDKQIQNVLDFLYINATFCYFSLNGFCQKRSLVQLCFPSHLMAEKPIYQHITLSAKKTRVMLAIQMQHKISYLNFWITFQRIK